MQERQKIAAAAAEKLGRADLGALRAVIGFDGFVDQIIDVVDRRHSPAHYDKLHTISQFGQKIAISAGKSANFELVVKHRKLGGNGTIMADALACLGVGVDYIGTVGEPGAMTFDFVFEEFSKRARLIPVAPPAHTNALEFLDGKVMLGDLAPLSLVTWERLMAHVGLEKMCALFEGATLLGMVNWTMLPHLTSIWKKVSEEVLPTLSGRKRRLFIDLADPEKRDPADLRGAMEVLAEIDGKLAGNGGGGVTLGLNLSEAVQVNAAMGLPRIGNPELAGGGARKLAEQIREKVGLATVVVHPRAGAAGATAEGSGEFVGPFVQQPTISTGAGDHFNAGFSAGELLGMTLVESLCMGTALSGYYVRHARSPEAGSFAGFLRELPPPQG